ncbi:hypothetical protein H5410_036442 [Solanum commersonii]|uniref:Uncharacterized protein n=1 Tax=Solanum commersonii TaxID=4109 RepID=A0A9J5Y5B9_SOLCO|nr:hypothetical protein H5410_036442 [Solanum commersonii]
MKPLKTENEVGSNMKSTIRYIFVALGAIGKGQGRGLKSLGEKGNTPSKSFLPQSSGLVKKYIKEIETSSIENDRGQGLKKANIFTCQGMQTIYKNSMVHEKENMHINTSFPTSAIQVEKCTTEVETRFSETEVGSFKKSGVCANQHMQTPSKRTKLSSTFSSSQEMQKMKKKLFLRKRKCKPMFHCLHLLINLIAKFESVDMNDHRDHILGWMNELWNKWRGHLHANYVKDKPIQQSLKNVPRGVDKKEWEWLVKEHFASESFQGGKDGNPPNLATIFFETRKNDSKLVEPEAIEKHVRLVNLIY